MYVYTKLEIPQNDGAVVALGYFDGVHLGHRKVIGRAVEIAAQRGLMPVVFTFSISAGEGPATKKRGIKLTSTEEKILAFKEIGVQTVIEPPFSLFSAYSPKEFVEKILVGCFNAKAVVCGENYRFGAEAAGDIDMLKSLCSAAGVEVVVVPPEMYEGEIISSTRIRYCIRTGNIEAAEAMLGKKKLTVGTALPPQK